MILSILIEPDARLHQACEEMAWSDRLWLALLQRDLLDTLKSRDAVGLAAPQIGVLRRVCVIQARPQSKPLLLVNPKILRAEGVEVAIEGCLSLPGVRVPVKRATYIEVFAANHEFLRSFRHLSARIVQHELDHLDGILITERGKKL